MIEELRKSVSKYLNLEESTDAELIEFLLNIVRVVTEDYTVNEFIERINK